MRYLSLDLGTRHTGIAYLDTTVGIPMPLDTIHHKKIDELLVSVTALIAERAIDEVIVGMPLLLSGQEGSQSTFVRETAEKLEDAGVTIRFVDERYTTPKSGKHAGGVDGDSVAACQLLASVPLK